MNLFVDRTQDPRGINIKGPALRVEPTHSEYTEALRDHTLPVAHDRKFGTHRRREFRILFGRVETHVENIDLEIIQLLGAVTQRREFRRSTRCEGLRKPGDHDTPLSEKVGATIQCPALPLEFEIRDRRANFWPGRCRREWSPSKNSSQKGSYIHGHTFARPAQGGKPLIVLPKRAPHPDMPLGRGSPSEVSNGWQTRF
jgi:hypothetical protein